MNFLRNNDKAMTVLLEKIEIHIRILTKKGTNILEKKDLLTSLNLLEELYNEENDVDNKFELFLEDVKIHLDSQDAIVTYQDGETLMFEKEFYLKDKDSNFLYNKGTKDALRIESIEMRDLHKNEKTNQYIWTPP